MPNLCVYEGVFVVSMSTTQNQAIVISVVPFSRSVLFVPSFEFDDHNDISLLLCSQFTVSAYQTKVFSLKTAKLIPRICTIQNKNKMLSHFIYTQRVHDMSCFCATCGDRWFNKTKQNITTESIHCTTFSFESNFTVESLFFVCYSHFPSPYAFLLDEVIPTWYVLSSFVIWILSSFFTFQHTGTNKQCFSVLLTGMFNVFFSRKERMKKRNNDGKIVMKTGRQKSFN